MLLKFRTFVVFVAAVILAFGSGASLHSSTVGAQELSGREIMDRTRSLDLVQDMSMDLEMTITNHRGQQRVRALTMSSLRMEDGTEYSLIRFTAPADVRGTGFLSIQDPGGNDENWIYLPALGRERRMASDERGGSFMGSDFTVEDISLNLDDYVFHLEGTETLSGVEVYVVSGVPATKQMVKDLGVSKRVYYVCPERFIALQTETFDEAGTLIRVMTTNDFIEVIDDLWIPKLSEMRNLESNSSTQLAYDNIAVNPGLTADDFSRRQLSRVR